MSAALKFVLLAMILAWFVLLWSLFRRLEKRHPAEYARLGRPTLLLRYGRHSRLAIFRFLVLRQHRRLRDAELSRLADLMLAFLAVYVALVGWIFASALLHLR